MALTQWMPVSRRGGGDWDTPSFTIPSGIDTVRVMLDVTPSNFSTPDLSVTMAIEVSMDGGSTWKLQMSTTWTGGTPPNNRGLLGWFAAVSGVGQYAGYLAHVHFSTVGDFRWGLQGEMI